MRIGSLTRALSLTAPFLVATNFVVRAQDNPVVYRDVETKYIFGFTEGSGIGLQGEKEFSTETVARFGKRHGRYPATQTKPENEFPPSQFVQFELGGLVASHDIKNVTNLDNRNAFEFSGLFGELRYFFLERGRNSPISG